ncbi:MAG: hypothetical protein LC772_09790, partial [Chloroflexi bacterium]|nr:hypothetical protein [Chloroflexota bacterium]
VRPPLSGRSAGGTTPFPSSLLVLFSGEDDGYLEPCGCSSPQTGGLPRRGSVLAGHPAAVAVDNGDWVDGPGRQQVLKAEAMARFFAAFHYVGVNPGEKDYALGYPQLMIFRENDRLPLLSTNVIMQGGGPAFDPFELIHRNGRKIAIFGELSLSFSDSVVAINPMLAVEDPAQSLDAAHKQAPADASILLYHGPAAEARALAERFPWLTLVITAHDGDDPQLLLASGHIPLQSVGQRARYLGRARLDAGAAVPTSSLKAAGLPAVALGPEYRDSPVARKLLRDYQAEVVADDLLAAVPRAPLQGNWYAGSAACASCHAAAYHTWARSAHRDAYSVLLRAGHSRDPDCVGCHVVGLDVVGGFTSLARTPRFAQVGCESCHGPQGLHASGKGPRPPKLSKQMCVDCHTPDQSPRFNLASYWPRITH